MSVSYQAPISELDHFECDKSFAAEHLGVESTLTAFRKNFKNFAKAACKSKYRKSFDIAEGNTMRGNHMTVFQAIPLLFRTWSEHRPLSAKEETVNDLRSLCFE